MRKSPLKEIKLFFELMFFKISPEALPYSKPLLYRVIIAYITMMGISLIQLHDHSGTEVILPVILSTAIAIWVVHDYLKFKKIAERSLKLLLALLGSSTIFFGLLLMAYLLLGHSAELFLFNFSLGLWELMLKIYIFCLGLEISRGKAFLLVLGFDLLKAVPILHLVVAQQ